MSKKYTVALTALLVAAPAIAQQSATPNPPAGYAEPVDAHSLIYQYAAAMQTKIMQHWVRPKSVVSGLRCAVDIEQAPGGKVTNVSIGDSCDFDAAGKKSALAAVKKASPLPYKGYELIYQKQIRFTFAPHG